MLKKTIILFGPGIIRDKELLSELEFIASLRTTADIEQLMSDIDHHEPDILLFEMIAETIQHLPAIKKIRSTHAPVKTLIFSRIEDRAHVATAISYGACEVFHQPYRLDLRVERITALLSGTF